MQRFKPELLFKPVMVLRPLFIWGSLAVVFWLLLGSLAFAQSTLPAPVAPTPGTGGDNFKELLCRMAVGNAQSGAQDRGDLFIELYAKPDATFKLRGRYGLLTGFYYGPRGASKHGPTLDDPTRYLKDGTPFTNGDAAHLRSITAEFRAGACDELPTPQ